MFVVHQNNPSSLSAVSQCAEQPESSWRNETAALLLDGCVTLVWVPRTLQLQHDLILPIPVWPTLTLLFLALPVRRSVTSRAKEMCRRVALLCAPGQIWKNIIGRTKKFSQLIDADDDDDADAAMLSMWCLLTLGCFTVHRCSQAKQRKLKAAWMFKFAL